MLSSRLFGSRWLLLLVLACSLLGRPLHDAWHAAHLTGDARPVSATAPLAAVGADPLVDDLAGHLAGLGGEAAGEEGDEAGVKADACAWCLFHAQAAATGRAPDALLTHAQASPPPAVLVGEPLRSLNWTVAKPRGPPSA